MLHRSKKVETPQPSDLINSSLLAKIKTQRPITDFVDLKQDLGASHTGHVFEEKLTHKKFVLKGNQVRPKIGRLMMSDASPGIEPYLDDQEVMISRKLTNEQIALEKLAYDLYAMCGVEVPKSLIVSSGIKKQRVYEETYKLSDGWGGITHLVSTGVKQNGSNNEIYEEIIAGNNKSERLFIASEKLPGFKSLDELLGMCGQDSSVKTNEKRVSLIADQKINGKPIKELFENLPVMAFLFDWDGLGSGLDNFGFLDHGDYYQFLKIDPAEVCPLTAPDGRAIEQYGFDALKEANGTILHQFQMYQNDQWNFQKLFKLATYEQKFDGIRRITALSDKQINDTVNNTEGARFIAEEKRKAIIQELIRRRDLFEKTYKQELAASLSLSLLRIKSLFVPQAKVEVVTTTFADKVTTLRK